MIQYSEVARQKLKIGIDAVANAVKVTIGPRGRNVILENTFGSPVITNDGVSIAQDVYLEDPIENIGASLVKEVATKTDAKVADGTTTSTILVQAIIAEGLKLIATGLNPVVLRRGIEMANNDILDLLKQNSKVIDSKEDIINVATVSAESREVGLLIADAIEKIGKDGVITVEESSDFGFSIKTTEGLQFNKGLVSPAFITKQGDMKVEIENPYVLITDKKISSIQDIAPILSKVLEDEHKKELLIIADEFEGEAFAVLVLNKRRGILDVACVKCPEYGDARREFLEDIAVMTGGKLISDSTGASLETATIADLGRADKVIASRHETTIIGGKGGKALIDQRVADIKKLIEDSTIEYDKVKYRMRLAKVTGGVAILKVGSATETEMTYWKKKLEDTIGATKSAIEEGIVAGGGVALVRAGKELAGRRQELVGAQSSEFLAGYDMLLDAVDRPTMQIIENCGRKDAQVVLAEIKNGKGFDADKGEFVDDMITAGIIDPLKVTRTALENAVSVASVFLTTEAVIARDKKNEDKL